jgi:CheY-like chemotaxis protein
MEGGFLMDELIEKKVIVVVEDNEEIAGLIKETLNEEPDYQAVAVHDGSRALEVIHSVKASLILMDIMLPGINGFELYDMLKADPATSEIPVIFLTATVHDEEFKKRNINNPMGKPFDIIELLARVAEVCRPD